MLAAIPDQAVSSRQHAQNPGSACGDSPRDIQASEAFSNRDSGSIFTVLHQSVGRGANFKFIAGPTLAMDDRNRFVHAERRVGHDVTWW